MSELSLDHLCTFINGGAWNEGEYVSSGHPVLKVSNIKGPSVDVDNLSYLSDEGLKKYERNVLQENDLVIATVGSHQGLIQSAAGRTIVIRKNIAGYLLNQNAVCLRTKRPDLLDQRYLGYMGESELFKNYIQVRGRGAANQMRIAVSEIKKFIPILPTLPIQKKIAGILSAYDDLIENNLKRIKLLEEMAQITYEEWFVRRRINGSIITDENIRYVAMKELISDYKNGGWGKEESEGKFTEEGYVIRGTDIPDILSGNFNSVPKRFHTQSNLEPRSLVAGDIIMEMSNGNIGNIGRSLYYDDSINAILGSKVMCASFCKMARAKNIGYSYLVHAHIKYIHKNNQMLVYKSQGANGINNFQFEQMIAEEIINIPENKQTLDELVIYFDSVYKSLSVLRKQIYFLKEARDILLQRLITGVIDVETYYPSQFLKDAA